MQIMGSLSLLSLVLVSATVILRGEYGWSSDSDQGLYELISYIVIIIVVVNDSQIKVPLVPV